MFIVQSGKVVVEREADGKVTRVATLGPGEFFGEMALMTGEQRMATVRAAEPSTLIGVEQPAMKTLLDASPELAGVLSRAIAERQEASAQSVRAASLAPAPDAVAARSSQLLDRIRRFFAV
jgi:CRP-like cAMP-binding protein